MTAKRLKIKLVNDCLVEAPIWEAVPRRSKNWCAIIDIDGTAPGGFSRRFLPYGRGPVMYMAEQVALFDALEFAADRIAWSGKQYPNRWFGVVMVKTDDFLELEETADGATAVILAKTCRTSREDVLRALRAEKEHLMAKAVAIEQEIMSVEASDAPGEGSKL